MVKHAILAAEFVFARAQRESRQRGATTMRTLAVFGCCLLMAGCATVLPGTLSDFSEMKAEVSVPIWRNILVQAPYRKILESSGPVAERHCASVGRKPVFVSMRGADIRSSVVAVGVTNTGDAWASSAVSSFMSRRHKINSCGCWSRQTRAGVTARRRWNLAGIRQRPSWQARSRSTRALFAGGAPFPGSPSMSGVHRPAGT